MLVCSTKFKYVSIFLTGIVDISEMLVCTTQFRYVSTFSTAPANILEKACLFDPAQIKFDFLHWVGRNYLKLVCLTQFILVSSFSTGIVDISEMLVCTTQFRYVSTFSTAPANILEKACLFDPVQICFDSRDCFDQLFEKFFFVWPSSDKIRLSSLGRSKLLKACLFDPVHISFQFLDWYDRHFKKAVCSTKFRYVSIFSIGKKNNWKCLSVRPTSNKIWFSRPECSIF